MKRLLTIFIAAAMLISASACGKKDKDENLSAEEIKSRANIAEDAKDGQDGTDGTDGADGAAATADPETEKRAEEIKDILEDMPIGELSEIVDTAENEYKSFELLPIEDTSFVIGKKMKLVATIADHQMSFVSQKDIKAEVTNEYISISYSDPEKEGERITKPNYVYGITDPIKTEGGSQYIAVAFGDHELTTENSNFLTDCFALIKMRDDVKIEGSDAETYVLLIEKDYPDKYEIFEVE
ncbi:MAG: hypothetical protein IJH37_03320 [Clostridia bacterium]|nr:hypothetical protein [Clostridia bacterium]